MPPTAKRNRGVDYSGRYRQHTRRVRITRGDHQYTAECLDLPVVTQAPTLDALPVSIQEAIALHLEGEDCAALGLVPNPKILVTIAPA